jgi:hypothetical protein
MTSSVDDFISALCPNLAADLNKDIYVEIAQGMLSSSYFGDKYNYAVALHASHNYTVDVSRPTGTAGLITGMTEGRTSMNFWNSIPQNDFSDLHMTTYGKRLKALMRSIGPVASVSDPNAVLG